MVPVDATDGATVAVAGVIHQDVDPELGEVTDLEGYRQTCYEKRVEKRSGCHAGDGSSETVNIAVRVAHCHGEEEGWF